MSPLFEDSPPGPSTFQAEENMRRLTGPRPLTDGLPKARKRVKWQDVVAAISNVLFAVALWPTVVAVAPPAVATSAMTIVALIALTVVMLSYRLWWGSFFQVCCMLMWVILLVQGIWFV